MMKVIVIGAGASGLMAAYSASLKGYDVTIIDGNEKCGKKMFITGKGRCNLTNNCSNNEFIKNVVTNPKFLYSSINTFSCLDTIEFFENQNLEVVTERGNRVFPKSGKSYDVINALVDACKNNGVKIILNNKVRKVEKKDDKFNVYTSTIIIPCDRLIIATGGASYKSTGSSGDGYYFAKLLGHSVTGIYPSLVPILIKDNFPMTFTKLELKNVSLTCKCKSGFKKTLMGEMRFIEKGIDGPIVLKMSALINKEEVNEMYIDLKPALDEETLDKRLIRELENSKHQVLLDVIKTLLPSVMINTFISRAKIDVNTKVNEVTKKTRYQIVQNLKHFNLTFEKLENLDHAIVTSGAVNVTEINPKTMESKLVKGLYFVGEVLDVDCFTGGFNMQAAFATGYACGYYLE